MDDGLIDPYAKAAKAGAQRGAAKAAPNASSPASTGGEILDPYAKESNGTKKKGASTKQGQALAKAAKEAAQKAKGGLSQPAHAAKAHTVSHDAAPIESGVDGAKTVGDLRKALRSQSHALVAFLTQGREDPALSGLITRGMTLYTHLDQQHAFRSQPALQGEAAAFYALASAAQHQKHPSGHPPEAAAKVLDKALTHYNGGNVSQLHLAQGLLARARGDHDGATIALLNAQKENSSPELRRPLLKAIFDEGAHASPMVKVEIRALFNDQVSRVAKQHWPDPSFKEFLESYIGTLD